MGSLSGAEETALIVWACVLPLTLLLCSLCCWALKRRGGGNGAVDFSARLENAEEAQAQVAPAPAGAADGDGAVAEVELGNKGEGERKEDAGAEPLTPTAMLRPRDAGETAMVSTLTQPSGTQHWWLDLQKGEGDHERHVLCVSAQRVTVLLAKASTRQELDTMLDPMDVKEVFVTGQGHVNVAAVPLEFFTDVTMTMRRAMTWLGWCAWRLKQGYHVLEVHAPEIIFLVGLGALASLLFVPLDFYEDPTDDTVSKLATRYAFGGVVIITVFHLILMNGLRYAASLPRSPLVRRGFWWYSILALVVVLLMVALGSFLVDLARTRDVADDDAIATPSQGNWIHRLSCDCEGYDDGESNNNNNNNKSSSSYHWTCSANDFSDANGKVCKLDDCGVCGDKFHDPWASLSFFLFMYMVLFVTPLLAFMFFGAQVLPKYSSKVPHYLEMTLHGASTVGYPLTVALSMRTACEAANTLSEMRHQQRDVLPSAEAQLKSSHVLSTANAASGLLDFSANAINGILDFALG